MCNTGPGGGALHGRLPQARRVLRPASHRQVHSGRVLWQDGPVRELDGRAHRRPAVQPIQDRSAPSHQESDMRRFMGLCATVAVAGVMAFGVAVAEDKAEKVAPDKLPKAVADAIKARFPAGEITGAEKEKEDGKIVYDIELKE